MSDTSFNGTLTAIVQGAEENVVCRLQNTSSDGAETAFEFIDRTSTIYKGQTAANDGKFAFEFVVPKDIRYTEPLETPCSCERGISCGQASS